MNDILIAALPPCSDSAAAMQGDPATERHEQQHVQLGLQWLLQDLG